MWYLLLVSSRIELRTQEFADYVNKKGGFTKFIEETPVLKSGHDSAVSNAVKTNRKKLLKELTVDNRSIDLKNAVSQNDEISAWAKALMEKVDGFDKKNTTIKQIRTSCG